jgi:hypothetical protein
MTAILPNQNTGAGVLSRLLILEAVGPGQPNYDATASQTSMQWMQLVIANRLKTKPAQFLAPNAKTILDIIKAPGQFAGFGSYPALPDDLAKRLNAIVAIANKPNDLRSSNYLAFVTAAISVAQSPCVADPSIAANPKSLGLLSWRTQNSGGPGSNFIFFKTLSGNSFYYMAK